MPLIVLSNNLAPSHLLYFICYILCRQAQPLLLSAKVTQKHFRQATLYQKCLCALPGALPRLRWQIASPVHLLISSMREHISIKSATMQSLYILQPCNIHLRKIFIVCIVAFFLLFRLDLIQFPIPRIVYLPRPNAKLPFCIFQCPL